MLRDYGIAELEEKIDYIINENPKTLNKLSELIFEEANCNGTILFNISDTKKEIYQNFEIEEIFEILYEYGYTMKDAADTLNISLIHLILCEKEFINYINEIYNKNIKKYPNFSEEDIVKTVIISIIENEFNNVTVDEYPELSQVKEKMNAKYAKLRVEIEKEMEILTNIIEKNDFTCIYDNYDITNENKTYYFGIFGHGSYGKDLTTELDLKELSIKEFLKELKSYIDNYDINYEVYIWLGPDGHGRNQAPDSIRDLLDSEEEYIEKLKKLYQDILNKIQNQKEDKK